MDALVLLESKLWHSISWHNLLSQFSCPGHEIYFFTVLHSPNPSKFFRDLVHVVIMLSEGKELISVTSGVRRSNLPNLCKSCCSLSPL